MSSRVQCDIVSAEEELFSGNITSITVDGIEGQLCVLPGHMPFLTQLKPGILRFRTDVGELEHLFVSGGYLEVQPNLVTVLADTAIRADDIDEAAALEAKTQAEAEMEQQKTDLDYAQMSGRLMQAVAQLRMLEEIKRLKKGG